jgi:hypothetical protein
VVFVQVVSVVVLLLAVVVAQRVVYVEVGTPVVAVAVEVESSAHRLWLLLSTVVAVALSALRCGRRGSIVTVVAVLLGVVASVVVAKVGVPW